MKLELKNITKTYGNVVALNNISLTFTDGIYGVLGENGAGKSTMINLITDNVPRDINCGDILYDGTDILKLGKDFRKLVGYMPQQQGYYNDFSAKAFLRYIAEIKGIKKHDADDQIDNLLKVVNLEDKKYEHIGGFSGGMKQRILFAQALLGNPKILILDEPTAGLDPKERIRMRNFISEVAKDKIVIIATHIVSDIECIAKDIILLGSGNVIDKGTPKELIKKLNGFVWEGSIDETELAEYSRKYCVSSVVLTGDSYRLRVVAENAPEGFEHAEPTLEEVYLYHFQYNE